MPRALTGGKIACAQGNERRAIVSEFLMSFDSYAKDYGTKLLQYGIKPRRHCERSEAIFARKQRLLRRVSLLAMTASPVLRLCSVRVLSHGPKQEKQLS